MCGAKGHQPQQPRTLRRAAAGLRHSRAPKQVHGEGEKRVSPHTQPQRPMPMPHRLRSRSTSPKPSNLPIKTCFPPQKPASFPVATPMPKKCARTASHAHLSNNPNPTIQIPVGCLPQTRRIQSRQILGHEDAVLADEFAVEPDFSTAPFRPLNQDHVPMDGAAIAVVAVLVRLAGREMQ